MRKSRALATAFLSLTFAVGSAVTPAWSSSETAARKPNACKKTSIGNLCIYFNKVKTDRYDISVDFTASKTVKSANLAYAQWKHTPDYDGRIDDMKKGDTRSAVWNNQNTTAGFAGCVKYKKNGKKKEECGWA